jgi:hypothetical protein
VLGGEIGLKKLAHFFINRRIANKPPHSLEYGLAKNAKGLDRRHSLPRKAIPAPNLSRLIGGHFQSAF